MKKQRIGENKLIQKEETIFDQIIDSISDSEMNEIFKKVEN